MTGNILIPPFKKNLAIGLACFFVLVALFWATDLDMVLLRLAYHPDPPHWPAQQLPPWSWMYHYGEAPGLVLGLAGTCLFISSFFAKDLRRFRGTGLYLSLVLVLGSGFIANVLCKNLMGRPRPEQLVAFDGFWEYLRPFQPGIPGKGQSLVSGHASVAFYFVCLYFVLPNGRRWTGLLIGLGWGAFMGIARVLQGAHFPSDVLLAGALMFTMSAALSPLICWQPRASFWRKPLMRPALAGLALGLLLVGFPVYEERHYLFLGPGQQEPPVKKPLQRIMPWDGGGQIEEIALSMELELGDVAVRFGDAGYPLVIRERFQGAGLGPAKALIDLSRREDAPRQRDSTQALSVRFRQRFRGLFLSRRASYDCVLSRRCPVDAKISSRGRIQVDPFLPGSQVLLAGNFDPDRLPAGFQAYGKQNFYRKGSGALLMLTLQGGDIIFRGESLTSSAVPQSPSDL